MSSEFENPLSEEKIKVLMNEIMSGQTEPERVKEFLTVLAKRGETAQEISSAVNVLRDHAIKLPLSQSYELCDTCGTGGDGHNTLNVSTLTALVAAASGIRIVKHGNRAASSQCGSADLLKELGINLEASPEVVAKCIEQLGFGFCFAPRFHPAMKAVAPIRKELAIRTIFNLVGPLANPAPLTFQLVGVSDERLLQPMAEALVQLRIKHGMVVHGNDGLDEVTTTTSSKALEVIEGKVNQKIINPGKLGIELVSLEQLRGGDASQNAQIAKEVLLDKKSPYHDIVTLNAGCVLYIGNKAESIEEGIEKAKEALRVGRAFEVLQKAIVLTNG